MVSSMSDPWQSEEREEDKPAPSPDVVKQTIRFIFMVALVTVSFVVMIAIWMMRQ